MEPGEVLFCEDGVPLVFGVRLHNVITVTAVYPNKRSISMESHQVPIGKAHEIGADVLRRVVTSPQLRDRLPS